MRWIKLEGRRGLAKREAAQQTRQYYLTVLNGIARIKALETTLLGYERGSAPAWTCLTPSASSTAPAAI